MILVSKIYSGKSKVIIKFDGINKVRCFCNLIGFFFSVFVMFVYEFFSGIFMFSIFFSCFSYFIRIDGWLKMIIIMRLIIIIKIEYIIFGILIMCIFIIYFFIVEGMFRM